MRTNYQWLSPHGGFTLIELLIVVSIIAIIGVTAISSFSGLLSGESTKTMAGNMNNTLQSLDDSISNNMSTSYEAVFKSGSIGFVAKKDFYRQKNTISLDFDFENGSGTLANISGFTGTWTYSMLYRERITGNAFMAENATTHFSLPASQRANEHEIDNILDDEKIGSFLIRYYSDGDMTDTPSQIQLISITGATASYDTVTLRNILGTRELIGSPGGEKLDEVTLIFRDNEKEIPVVIRK